MISVCMATKNGAAFIAEQIDSILPQLHAADELIISDDASSDATLQIVGTYHDRRIKLIRHRHPIGITKNFEVALQQSAGKYIFLADQDDVWLPEKISIMKRYLGHYDLVISDCLLVDHLLRPRPNSYFSANHSRKGFLKNLFRNSYMGCCMAFNRTLLNRALPFPKDIPIHDFWIGLIGDLYFKVCFLPEVLLYHRRHSSNATTTGALSTLTLSQKVGNRYRVIKNLFLHKSYAS
jgi:glycosyltransferase involved in cell wall biosynthesis